MSPQTTSPRSGDGGAATRDVDWVAVERSPEFQELVRAKRRFIIPAGTFAFVWYFAFILLAGYAESFMGESIYQGFTVGYALALSQFVMTWALGAMYVRRAGRVWDPLAQEAIRSATAGGSSPATAGTPASPPRTGEEVSR